MRCNMEYKKLEIPIYWMGYVKGKFTKRKFVKYQSKYPSWCMADDNRTVRRITNRSKMHFGELQIVGGYSIYSYKEFTKEQEVEFFKAIVKCENERIKKHQIEIGEIIEERDKVIELIKERENG